MVKRIVHIILTGFLSLLLLFGGTAKEFVHSFADHHDTIHTHHDGISFENEHHHCSFLDFVLHPYIQDAQQLTYSFFTVEYAGYAPSFYIALHTQSVSSACLRGPPVLAA